jgi:hypothetical protein
MHSCEAAGPRQVGEREDGGRAGRLARQQAGTCFACMKIPCPGKMHSHHITKISGWSNLLGHSLSQVTLWSWTVGQLSKVYLQVGCTSAPASAVRQAAKRGANVASDAIVCDNNNPHWSTTRNSSSRCGVKQATPAMQCCLTCSLCLEHMSSLMFESFWLHPQSQTCQGTLMSQTRFLKRYVPRSTGSGRLAWRLAALASAKMACMAVTSCLFLPAFVLHWLTDWLQTRGGRKKAATLKFVKGYRVVEDSVVRRLLASLNRATCATDTAVYVPPQPACQL